jgi:hypothetical protein
MSEVPGSGLSVLAFLPKKIAWPQNAPMHINSTRKIGKGLILAVLAIASGLLLSPAGASLLESRVVLESSAAPEGKSLSHGRATVLDDSKKVSKMNGVSLTAPPQEIPSRLIGEVKSQTGASWVSVIPYSFIFEGETETHFDVERQWWGERSVGVIRQIQYAKEHGMQVMLKPHVWVVHGGWIGEFGYDTQTEWQAWEKSYRDYVLHFARLADSMKVELFCFSTETDRAVKERPDFWKDLIKEIRAIYHGPITYAANWDNYQNIPFWSSLDYIGIDAYFPLSSESSPGLDTLLRAWKPYLREINAFQVEIGKPVLFTEYGYLSVANSAWRTWELENQLNELEADQTAQARAYEAMYQTFWDKEWFAGGFLWKWFLYDKAGGKDDRDYTPQDKPVLQVIRSYYE